ncbi:MAG TPA: GDSL-type esterase/lipase family protein, partial [Polyangiaceae bacterium]|nr:GDSL-type esterase/lipase family protein [Polyangiaceae bacterium]
AAGGASTSNSPASASSTADASATSTNGGSPFPQGVTRPRIMIVGDSISAGPGCYKKYLVEHLTENGITNYEFVGEYDDDCGGGVKHSAVSCTTSSQYAEATFTVPNCFGSDAFPGMSTLVQSHDPDLILLQLGVNDVWGGSAPIQPILDNYATLIAQARAHNPNIVVVVAQIHKIVTDNCQNTASTANAEALVMAVPAWAHGVSTLDSPVMVADLWTNSDAHEADDCVHPNDAGAQRMGLNWYNALADVLR